MSEKEEGELISPMKQQPESLVGQLSFAKEAKIGRRAYACSSITDFEVKEKIGEGTFGEVYKAVDKRTDREVALKKILNRAEQEGFPITALREIKLLKNLHHSNIVDLIDMVYERDNDGQMVSVFMEFGYMDHDLTGLLERKDVFFSLPQIKCYLQQLLHGLKYLHERTILHRDIKGSNILLNNRGEVRLTDFGLSRPLEEGRREYTPGVFTRWYRPPELLLGSRVYDTSADMWGVGCIIAEMFIKKPLFPGDGDFHQLELISRLCGTPSDDTMPGFSSLPNAEKIQLPVFRRRINEHFEKLDPLARDLIDKILVLDPKKRIGAAEALKHSFFTTVPLPALPQSLPTYSSSHELGSQKASELHPPHPTPHEHAAPVSQINEEPRHERRGSRESREHSLRPRLSSGYQPIEYRSHDYHPQRVNEPPRRQYEHHRYDYSLQSRPGHLKRSWQIDSDHNTRVGNYTDRGYLQEESYRSSNRQSRGSRSRSPGHYRQYHSREMYAPHDLRNSHNSHNPHVSSRIPSHSNNAHTSNHEFRERKQADYGDL